MLLIKIVVFLYLSREIVEYSFKLNKIEYFLSESNFTEVSYCITQGISQLTSVMYNSANHIFIHPIPQSTTRASNIKRRSKIKVY